MERVMLSLLFNFLWGDRIKLCSRFTHSSGLSDLYSGVTYEDGISARVPTLVSNMQDKYLVALQPLNSLEISLPKITIKPNFIGTFC